jgi:bifunctional N-acetylglucosamine-1-phosphate-uridyltransferase/glucosamine-1-phosphate-acetyltransferase GlmU-like protein
MECIQEKKPFTEDRMSEYASNGTYYFKSGRMMKQYFSMLMNLSETINNEYYVSMVYNLMKRDGLIINIFEIDYMLQWGTPYDLNVYNMWSNYFNNITIHQSTPIDRHNIALILPMAGAGTRFSTKGYKNPKPLLDICNAPMIVQAVKCLPETTTKHFICLDEHIRLYNIDKILKSTFSNCNVFSIDSVTQGQACTTEIGVNKGAIDYHSPILVSACDNGVYYNKQKYQELLDDNTIDIIVWTFRNNPTSINNPNMYAWVQTDNFDNVLNVSCKKFIPSIHNLKDSHVIIGTMFFRKASYFMDGLKQNYEEDKRSNGEFYVDDVLNQNVKCGLKIKVFEVDNYICWGTPDDYETYLYWQRFFNKCNWHKYKINDDITFNRNVHPQWNA